MDRPLKVWGQVTHEQLADIGKGIEALKESIPRVKKQVEIGESYRKSSGYDRKMRKAQGRTGWTKPTKTTKG